MTTTLNHGVFIRSNARDAKKASHCLSATRNFIPVGRGLYFLSSGSNESQAIRDADWLTTNGYDVEEVI